MVKLQWGANIAQFNSANKSDRRYVKLRNEKIDDIKRQIISLYEKYENIDNMNEKENLITEINKHKQTLKNELKIYRRE